MAWKYGWLEKLTLGDFVFFCPESGAREVDIDYVRRVEFVRVGWNPAKDYTAHPTDNFIVELRERRGAPPFRASARTTAPYDPRVWGMVQDARTVKRYFDLFTKGRHASAVQVMGLDEIGLSRRKVVERGSTTIKMPPMPVRFDLFLSSPQPNPTEDAEEQEVRRGPDFGFIDHTTSERKDDKPEDSDIPF